jgi:undecaprenyl diphosphate synthase
LIIDAKVIHVKSNMSRIPMHVALIMDGNGRWAQMRGLPRHEGHRRGASVIKKILRAAEKKGLGM